MLGDGIIPSITAKGMQLKDAEPVACDACGCNYFIQVIKVLKISKLKTGKTSDTLIQQPALRCSDCGTLVDLE